LAAFLGGIRRIRDWIFHVLAADRYLMLDLIGNGALDFVGGSGLAAAQRQNADESSYGWKPHSFSPLVPIYINDGCLPREIRSHIFHWSPEPARRLRIFEIFFLRCYRPKLSQLRHKLEYFPVWLMARCGGVLPRPLARGFCQGIALLMYTGHRRLRK